MNRRNFVERVALTTGTALAASTSHAAAVSSAGTTVGKFDVTEKTVAQLQAAMSAGTLNSEQLVQLYNLCKLCVFPS